MYRSHVLVCGGTGCTSSGSQQIINTLEAEIAKNGLRRIHNELHDARFDGGDMLLELDNGYIFFIQGFTTRESFDKAMGEAKNGRKSDEIIPVQREGSVQDDEGREDK